MHQDAIFEISRLDEPVILKRLLQILEEGTQYFLQDKKRTEEENRYYPTMVKALGRLKDSEKAGQEDNKSALLLPVQTTFDGIIYQTCVKKTAM